MFTVLKISFNKGKGGEDGMKGLHITISTDWWKCVKIVVNRWGGGAGVTSADFSSVVKEGWKIFTLNQLDFKFWSLDKKRPWTLCFIINPPVSQGLWFCLEQYHLKPGSSSMLRDTTGLPLVVWLSRIIGFSLSYMNITLKWMFLWTPARETGFTSEEVLTTFGLLAQMCTFHPDPVIRWCWNSPVSSLLIAAAKKKSDVAPGQGHLQHIVLRRSWPWTWTRREEEDRLYYSPKKNRGWKSIWIHAATNGGYMKLRWAERCKWSCHN